MTQNRKAAQRPWPLIILGGIMAVAVSITGALRIANHPEGHLFAQDESEISEPSLSEAFAKDVKLPYFATSDFYSPEILSRQMRQEAPDFSHMWMIEGEKRYTPRGVSTKEIFFVDLYVHEQRRVFVPTVHVVYLNRCTVEDNQVRGAIAYDSLVTPERIAIEEHADKEEALAVQSQQQCRILHKNGHFDAFKAFSLERASAG